MCPPRTRGQWSAQSMARLPPLWSQPACHQDRVVASGADAVLGRQVKERQGNIEERLCQMEAQLQEKSKELRWVGVLTGRPRLGRRPGWAGLVLLRRRSCLCCRVWCVALSADPGTQPQEQGQMWSPVGGGQGRGGPHVQGGHLLL